MTLNNSLGKKALYFTSLSFISLFTFIQCQEPYSPTVESASEILKTLSSDDMRGRYAFSEDIIKAEDFIASEFKKAGLTAISGSDGFKQTFQLKEISTETVSISVSGKNLPKNSYFAFLDGSEINWEANSVETTSISKDANFRDRMNELSESESDLVVFIDPSFEDIFSRYQAFYSRPSRKFEDEMGSNIVFILSKPGENFSIQLSPKLESKSLSNVVGMIEGKRKTELVLFSAHHDHIGIRLEVEGDSIANGANDDASGVTAVIELAKHFASKGKPERTIVFATFTAEESGGYGSQYFSKQFNPDEIIAMFNIEMIGKPAVSGPNTAWITGYDRSTFGELLSKSAEGTIYEFYPDPYPTQNLFYRSDNATLARLGVPAHSISTTPIDVDADYHQVSDEFETIDIAHMTNTITAIAKAAQGIVSGKDTPSRVDKNLVN